MIDFWTLINKYPSNKWDWSGISQNAQITWDIICSNPTKPWNSKAISRNPNITWDIVNDFPKGPFKKSSWKWNYNHLCANPNITLDIIDMHPELFVNYNKISQNPNITWEYISKNMHRPWNWNYLTYHQNITLDIIIENAHLNWNLIYISKNPNINIKFLFDNPNGFDLKKRHVKWDWFDLRVNPSFCSEDMMSHPNMDCSWDSEIHNPSVCCEDMLNNYDNYCDMYDKSDDPDRKFWVNLSCNPNVTPWFVEKHIIEPWDISELSRNDMNAPYYKSKHHGKKLAKTLIDAIFDELNMKVCHPRRHISKCILHLED